MRSSKTVTDGTDAPILQRSDLNNSESRSQDNKYTSKFTTEFDLPVQCLGKGGFGIVFESRKKFDKCFYAVKRIRLPSEQAAREKVFREVEALAKLDHPHIVRYYNAWEETPPRGWLETFDETLKLSLPLSSTNALSDAVGTVATAATESSAVTKDPLRPATVNPLKPFDDFFDEPTVNGCVSIVGDGGSASGSWYNGAEDGEDDSDECEKEKVCHAASDREDSVVFQSSSGDHSIVFESRKSEEISTENSLKEKMSRSGTGDCKAIAVRKRPSRLQHDAAPSTQPVYLYIQMQLCSEGSLKKWLSDCNTRALRGGHDKILKMVTQISSAVEYVHEKGLIHRDLKPSNIFLATADGDVKVGDFGLVTGINNSPASDHTPGGSDENDGNFNDVQLTAEVGTQLYMSPEQISGYKYNQKVDIFSLGLIFFELLWLLPTQMERINALTDIRELRFPENFEKTFPAEYELIRQMVAEDPTNRPSASEVRVQFEGIKFFLIIDPTNGWDQLLG